MRRFIVTVSATFLTATASFALPAPVQDTVDMMQADTGVATMQEVKLDPKLVRALRQSS